MPNETDRPAALITGGTSGIGLATARLLNQRGYNVIVTGRNPETIASARASLPNDVVILEADIRSHTDTERVAAAARQLGGQLSAVFLNAGIGEMVRSRRSTKSASIDTSTPTSKASSLPSRASSHC